MLAAAAVVVLPGLSTGLWYLIYPDPLCSSKQFRCITFIKQSELLRERIESYNSLPSLISSNYCY
jgi:hypothetical protein